MADQLLATKKCLAFRLEGQSKEPSLDWEIRVVSRIDYASWQREKPLHVHRKALVPVQRSPWKKLLQRGRDQEFMLSLGINGFAFEILLSAFNRVWPRKRTRFFTSEDVLALSLVWINSNCRQNHLFSMFAMNQGCVSYSLDLGMACLHRQIFWARIEWLSREKITEFCSMIRSKEPSFIDVFGLVDGLNLPMQNHWNADLQND